MLRERESPQAKRYARLVEQEKPRVDVGGAMSSRPLLLAVPSA
jgi:hypothetical protein